MSDRTSFRNKSLSGNFPKLSRTPSRSPPSPHQRHPPSPPTAINFGRNKGQQSSRPQSAGYFDIVKLPSLQKNKQTPSKGHPMPNRIMHQRTSSESSMSGAPPAHVPRLVRNKSGEVVRSSMKSSRRPAAASLSIDTSIIPSNPESFHDISAQSAPLKSVQFDEQLEHVKHFIAEQRPTAVSRDGSPTDDTATETEFPSFIFGHDRKTRLSMTMDPIIPRHGDDVSLASLVLSEDGNTVTSRIRVRNIAFQKWVSARYTFDSWQTTHEVTGRYIMSQDNGIFDIFECAIRLNAGMEGRTMLLAIRYTSNGREMWDNNRGRNYEAKFSRVAIRPHNPNIMPVVSLRPTPIIRQVKSGDSSDEEDVVFRTRNNSRRRVASPDAKPSLRRHYQPPSSSDRTTTLIYATRTPSPTRPVDMETKAKPVTHVITNDAYVPWASKLPNGGSDESTPSMLSPSGSTSSSSEPDDENPLLEPASSPMENVEYNSMVNRFCFFTGSGSPVQAS